MQARYYDPLIGRFLSNDPVGFAEGGPTYFNRYAYTANNPVNNIDPDGRKIAFANGISQTDQQAFLEILGKVAAADPKFAQRIADIHSSNNLHIITTPEVAKASNTENIKRAGELAPTNIGQAPQENESNGVGTGSLTVLDPHNDTSAMKSDGSSIMSSPEATLVHEFLSHAYEKDRGIHDRSPDALTGVAGDEQRAMDLADEYRGIVGEETRGN